MYDTTRMMGIRCRGLVLCGLISMYVCMGDYFGILGLEMWCRWCVGGFF